MSADEFGEFLFELLSKLKTHDWVNKQQQEALRKRKQDLQEGEVILAGDFSENYSSLIQVRCCSFTVILQKSLKKHFFSGRGSGLPLHYWLRPIESGQLGSQNFAFHFIFIQIFQIEFSTLHFILSASNYFR